MLMPLTDTVFLPLNDGRCVLVLDDGERKVGYVIGQMYLKHFSAEVSHHPIYAMGDKAPRMVPGQSEFNLEFTGFDFEVVEGEELENLLDPFINKSILELSQAINKKLAERTGT